MKNPKYNFLPPSEIFPQGWLLDQLKIQAAGLSGNLDKIWPDVRDSKWVGGGREGWERVPYWLDGFIPLAYLLRDADMITRARRYVDAIIAGQKEDGWLCPCQDNERDRYDMWALLLIGKVLALYADCSGDPRIEEVLYRAMKQFSRHNFGNTLFGWGASRWFEGLIPLLWLYKRRPEEWILRLAQSLKVQGIDWKSLFEDYRDTDAKRRWGFETHVVNLGMAVKADALYALFNDKDTGAGEASSHHIYDMLLKYHGTAIGHFTGDECVAGHSPIQGTELCAVVELMYSCEWLFAVTGDTRWGELLESLAVNSLPATVSPDMWTHQYDQQVNQVSCQNTGDRSIFLTNNQVAHTFGLEPNYGCCTANFNQGFPKYALSSFMKSAEGDEIFSLTLAPCEIRTTVKGIPVKVKLETLYPFREKLTYTVTVEKPVEFALSVRIPATCSYILNGKKYTNTNCSVAQYKQIWKGTTTIELIFAPETVLTKRPENMFVLRRGPLFYSVEIGEEWHKKEYSENGVDRKFPYCDYEITPTTDWQYAFAENPDLKVTEHDYKGMPFSSEKPPVTLEASLVPINWGYEDGYRGVARRTPLSRVPMGAAKRVRLKPYGCTNLRITEIPKMGE